MFNCEHEDFGVDPSKPETCLEHYAYELIGWRYGTDPAEDHNRIIAIEYAFDSLWIIVSEDQKSLYRLGGKGPRPPDVLIMSKYFTLPASLESDGDDSDPAAGEFDGTKKRHKI